MCECAWQQPCATANPGYSVGEKVQMRDGREDSKTGHVTSVSPLKVAFDHETHGKGYSWAKVHKC